MYDIAVSFETVRKCFDKIEALRGISFEMQAGEVFGFIGPNGCGKTTTVRLMLGFYKPKHGTVRIFGSDPASKLSRVGSRIGVMLEQPGIYDYLTAKEYLEFYGGIYRMPSSLLRARTQELLKLVGLSDRANSLLRTYSKGMRQRISMARCMLNEPLLMILDEPFDGLDVESRRIILDILPRLAKERGTAVFVTSHNLAEVEEISSRVAIIKQGRILAVDTIDLLKSRITNSKVLLINLARDYQESEIAKLVPDAEYSRKTLNLKFNLASVNGNQNELLTRLLQAGISINSVSAESTTLEDVYFALTKEAQE
jgi:ABC-2 type transport system ATP-binding protein